MKNQISAVMMVFFVLLLFQSGQLFAEEEGHDPLKLLFLPVMRVIVTPVKLFCSAVDYAVQGAVSVVTTPAEPVGTQLVEPATGAIEELTMHPVTVVKAGKDTVFLPFHTGMKCLGETVAVPLKVLDDASKVAYQPLVFVVREGIQKPIGGTTDAIGTALGTEGEIAEEENE